MYDHTGDKPYSYGTLENHTHTKTVLNCICMITLETSLIVMELWKIIHTQKQS